MKPALIAASAAVVALVGCSAPPPPGVPGPTDRSVRPPASAFEATVVRVVDGDTFHADVGGREVTVRLIGIDTPETKRPGTSVQCWGPQATAALERLLPVGRVVRAAYEAGHPRDKYDRDLWDVWLGDGSFVNGTQVLAGDAVARSYPPTTRYAGGLRTAQSAARTAGRGLWGACPADQIPKHD